MRAWRNGATDAAISLSSPVCVWSTKPCSHIVSISPYCCSRLSGRSSCGYATSSYGMYFEHSGSLLSVKCVKTAGGFASSRRAFAFAGSRRRAFFFDPFRGGSAGTLDAMPARRRRSVPTTSTS